MLQSVFSESISAVGNERLILIRDLGIFASVALTLYVVWFNFLYVPRPSTPGTDQSPPELQLSASKTAQSFFEKQFDFINDGFKATSSSIYQLTLFGRKAIVLSGTEARQVFTKENGLNIYDSFSILLGSNNAQFSPHQVNAIIKRMVLMQRPENLQSIIPSILSSCKQAMNSWAPERLLDPCSSIHKVTFQTIMSTGFFDISQDPALCSHFKSLVDVVDSPANPYTTWCSWLPNMLMLRKLVAAARMYLIVRRHILIRKRDGVRRNDAIQKMIDDGDSNTQIFGFLLGLSLAGARATGTIVSWLIMRLSTNPQWSKTIQKEIQTLLSQTSQTSLSSIPLQSWETQTPMLDLCIRETIRTSQPYAAMRRNNGPDLTIGGHTIPSGALVMYPFADTSLNPAYYPDPRRWDPSREVKKEFICWGAGKHGCKGQRLAMLNMKLVAVSILTRFDPSSPHLLLLSIANATSSSAHHGRLQSTMADNFQQMPSSLDENQTMGMAVIIIISIALYNALELSVLIPLSFKTYRSLYFWALLISTTVGLIPTSLGTSFQYFNIVPLWLSLLLSNIGFICMVPIQSVVLYSRLHLISQNFRLLRIIKWMIIIDSIILLIPTVTMNFGSEYFPRSAWVHGFSIVERAQITWFSVQEILISSVYIWETVRMIKISPEEDKKRHKILLELIGINIIAISMDLSLLILEFLGYYFTQIILKALVYSIKLKMEFAVLGMLLSIVRSHSRELTSGEMYSFPSG
ncbi:Cytochrome P450 [Penicillium brevicompactum]|uniref:Cytochrome P450 n=1 Tax=Penicillium brevicompactum TaxID=5074 RepID=A0A9W9UJC8_PENBR|nr:Cytochrome P450 [Penicillium brevicompactum]